MEKQWTWLGHVARLLEKRWARRCLHWRGAAWRDESTHLCRIRKKAGLPAIDSIVCGAFASPGITPAPMIAQS